MNVGDFGVIFGLLLCLGIVISMVIQLRIPRKYKESYAEVINKKNFFDPDHHENGIRVVNDIVRIPKIIGKN